MARVLAVEAARHLRPGGVRDMAVTGSAVSRAVVFNGDETWELRELPVPDPQPGGAVLRVEATGLCHSDVDHFRSHVPTSWGGAFPSIAGHEIVGRVEKTDLAAARLDAPLCPVATTRVSRFFSIADSERTPIPLQEFGGARGRLAELFGPPAES
ncbi:hypothetical protein BCD48_44345 [Pseudofrankia sp. BMG5.36]|nr:hypothetical protein BCD48_44345 [Pseudofrankia sp. BMG5.36]